MIYGVFMRVNYQDGLQVGHIENGLVGSVIIKEVPDSFTKEDVETLVLCQGLGFKFGEELHDNVVLAEKDFPNIHRFDCEVVFDGLFIRAIKQLTKQRIAREKTI